MPSPSPDSRRALLMIGGLYVSQGLPMGLAFMALPAILRTQGFSTEAIGAVGLVILPWALKFLWAPLVDRKRAGRWGPRKLWIVPAQLILAVLYMVIALVAQRQGSLSAMIALLLFANLVSATQDIATDGWATELLRGRHAGSVNGLQIGGFSLGMFVSGSAAPALFAHGGWFMVFGVQSALTLLSILPVLTVADTPMATAPDSKPSLRAMLGRPDAWAMLSIAAGFQFAAAMSGAMLGPFLIDKGWSLEDIGLLTGVRIGAAAVLGALAGAVVTRRLGPARAAVYSGALAALSLFVWPIAAAMPMVTLELAIGATFVTGIVGGCAYVAFFALFMQWASLKQAGTDFTVLQCAESWTNIIAALLAGWLAAQWTFGGLFMAATLIGLAVIAWIAVILRRYPKEGEGHA